MQDHQQEGVCRENDVSCAGCFVIRGYYAWCKRDPSVRQRQNESEYFPQSSHKS